MVPLEPSLTRLGLDYVDLYLIHWPAGGPPWAWPGIRQAQQLGQARPIGISNFALDALRALLQTAEIAPAVNQVQFSPHEQRVRLLDGCQQKGVVLELRRQRPESHILVLSQHAEQQYALDLVGDEPAGVGYPLKERVGDVETFIDALERVAQGGTVLDAEMVALMLGRRRPVDPLASLTPRERDVLGAMAEGKSNAASPPSS